jgi:phosphate transport system ATP-binding protein
MTRAPDVHLAHVGAAFGTRQVLTDVSLRCAAGAVTALIGPSGAGKSTVLRCINRLHELTAGAWSTGSITIGELHALDPSTDPIRLRQRIGMVFQRPTPFPTMSIFDNVAAGLRAADRDMTRTRLADRVEFALRRSGLWTEVADRLHGQATALSGGQQQRLCIARAIAAEPEVLLLDEPCSALDPIATGKVEELIQELRGRYSVLIVTHNMQQASRTSDYTAFMYLGRLIEYGSTSGIFTKPILRETEAYVTGRFG